MEDKKFTPQIVQELRTDIEKALVDVAKKYGVVIQAGSGRYGAYDMILKLEIRYAASESFDPAKAAWEEYFKTPFAGLTKDDFGKEVNLDGKRYIISGVNPSAKTNKILIREVASGKEFTSTIPTIRVCLHPETFAPHPEKTEEQKRNEFGVHAFIAGLNQYRDKYGFVFDFNGESYRAVDIRTKAPKYPVLAENVKTGKQFAFPASVLEG